MYDNLVKALLEDKESLIQPIYIKCDATNIGVLCNASLCYNLHLNVVCHFT